MKDKFINFRASEKEKKQLTALAKKAKMSQADFIRHAVFNKEIIVIDGLKPIQNELKRIGNNLNQLTTRSNLGQFSVIDLHETKEQMGKIHESIINLCNKKNEKINIEPKSEKTVLQDHRPKLGERRNNSILNSSFDRNRGD